MIETKQQAEDYVYASYLKALPYLRYEDRDSVKRHPELVASLIAGLVTAPNIVVTGSKGKGSTCALLDALLSRRLVVGRLTSPHIMDFNERIRVSGEPISDDALVRATGAVERLFSQVMAGLAPQEFVSPIAIQVACALLHFDACATDVNVLECGKGARYDDVAWVPHDYAVVTPVFLEHTRELGPTLEVIARDKAYVIQQGMKGVFVGRQHKEVAAIMERRADKLGVRLHAYGRSFTARDVCLSWEGTSFSVDTELSSHEGLHVPLLGAHQAENAALAIALAEEIVGVLSDDVIRDALATVSLPGRMEVLSTQPFMLLDACINRESCRVVVDALDELGIKDCHLVVCVPSDKDYIGVVSEIAPRACTVTLTRADNPHYRFSVAQVHEVLCCVPGVAVDWACSLEEAVETARVDGRPIVILGTTAAVGEVKRLQDLRGW